MRVHQLLLSSAVSVSLSIGMAPPAMAQSFFQKLFGFGSAGPAPAPVARPQALPAQRFYNRPRHSTRPVEEPSEDEDIGPPDSGGPYRTMCVRACDGYYFPLRHNAWHRNFAADAMSCRNACGGEGRLFYYSLNGGSVDTMTDLAGRPYTEMKTAFNYRKALVNGCTCRPAPWSTEEAARHRRYEEIETAAGNGSRFEPTNAADSLTEEKASGGGKGSDPALSNENADATNDAGTAAANNSEQKLSSPEQGGDVLPSETAGTAEDRPRAATEPAVASSKRTRAGAFEAPATKRRRPRFANRGYAKAAFPSSQGFGLFGPSKSKFIWPGDTR